jgi:hypothetical protein
VHIDFAGAFEDRMFLIAVDAHSKWPEMAIMRSTTAEKTIEKLGEMFSRFGSPAQLVSDNGPQLSHREWLGSYKLMEFNTLSQFLTTPQQMVSLKGSFRP